MAKLRFEIDGEPSNIAFESFVYASQKFLRLLREIDQVISGRYRGTLRWYVSALESNGGLSVDVFSRLKPPPSRKKQFADVSGHVAGSLVTGFNNVQNLGISPPYLSHYGLEDLSEMLLVLEKNGARAYRTTDLDHGRTAELSRVASDNVRALLPTRRRTIGSVEGKLEAISIHRTKRFVVYDGLTKKAINCEFSDAATLDRVKDLLGERVLVSGMVHWNIKSEPNKVQVDDVRKLGGPNLPKTDDLSGAYPEITDGMSVTDYMRSIRGD
jgi:hypothetical protein